MTRVRITDLMNPIKQIFSNVHNFMEYDGMQQDSASEHYLRKSKEGNYIKVESILRGTITWILMIQTPY